MFLGFSIFCLLHVGADLRAPMQLIVVNKDVTFSFGLGEMAARIGSAKVHHLNGFSSQGSEINQISSLDVLCMHPVTASGSKHR